jgi:D-glycero-D-manno-heptose 1,7-bisphosphate phosphatase
VPEAIAQLNRSAYASLLFLTRRGIALNLYTAADVQTIHSRFQDLFASHEARIDAFYIFPMKRDNATIGSQCRACLERQLSTSLTSVANSVMIGDSFSDMEFGARLGMETVLIEGTSGRQSPCNEKAPSLAINFHPWLRRCGKSFNHNSEVA